MMAAPESGTPPTCLAVRAGSVLVHRVGQSDPLCAHPQEGVLGSKPEHREEVVAAVFDLLERKCSGVPHERNLGLQNPLRYLEGLPNAPGASGGIAVLAEELLDHDHSGPPLRDWRQQQEP